MRGEGATTTAANRDPENPGAGMWPPAQRRKPRTRGRHP